MPAKRATKHLRKGKKLQRTRPLDIKLGSNIKGESQDATYPTKIDVSN